MLKYYKTGIYRGKMKVYHGSDTLILDIDLTQSKAHKDFGKGFYVTENRQYAEICARETAQSQNKQGIVTEFIFDEGALNDCRFNTLRFETYNEAWLNFVTANRNEDLTAKIHDFDIIEGPIAPFYIDDYRKGMITGKESSARLKHEEIIFQICFCTVKSLQTLKIL
jgi:hypothetical protein